MFETLLAAGASLAAIFKHVIVTTDSNTFPPETDKMTSIGMVRRKKMWVVCDGSGKMYFIHIQTLADVIRDLAKLRDEGALTEEEFQQSKASALRKLGGDSEEATQGGGPPT